MNKKDSILERIQGAVNRQRMIDAALSIMLVHTPTGNAGEAADRLATILAKEGLQVDRPAAGHAKAPAVVAVLDSNRPGPTLQFDGHLDTVHLPFVPPKVNGDLLTGSGASDMKGGIAAALEALLILRDLDALSAGKLLFTAHDLHEAPWGDGSQLDQLIRDGVHGDAVLIPEPYSDNLSIAGRGSATWKITFRRAGAPVHEVMRPTEEPSVLEAGAEFILRLKDFDRRLAERSDPIAGPETVFAGQMHCGEIYNQFAKECWLEGTRRWLAGTTREEVKGEFLSLVADHAKAAGVSAETDVRFVRDPFHLDPLDPFVEVFQRAHERISGGRLKLGAKMFVDDGSTFSSLANVPAITHGPKAGGQHTLAEWASIEDMARIARLYAFIAVSYLNPNGE